MNNQKLLSNLHEKEEKLLNRIVQEKEDFQLIACNEFESSIIIDGTIIEHANIFTGYIGENGKSCKGKYGQEHFSITQDTALLRVFVDSRKAENRRLHVNYNGSYTKLSNDSETNGTFLIMLIESPTFIQFTLFNDELSENKISHIFATSPTIRTHFRSIAYSILNLQFKGFSDYLTELEMKNHGKED